MKYWQSWDEEPVGDTLMFKLQQNFPVLQIMTKYLQN